MINLIPIERRRMMQRAFYVRFATVFLFALGAALVAGAVALLPAYFSATVKLSVAESSLAKEQADLLTPEELKVKERIQSLENKLGIVHASQYEKYIVSERVIDTVMQKKTSDIRIQKIRYATVANKKTVVVEGNARSRESLLNFRIALEKDSSWTKVDLPISNFVRGVDIDFTVTLLPREE